jgi:hypothetical protein
LLRLTALKISLRPICNEGNTSFGAPVFAMTKGIGMRITGDKKLYKKGIKIERFGQKKICKNLQVSNIKVTFVIQFLKRLFPHFKICCNIY